MMVKLNKYTNDCVEREAELYFTGYTITAIASRLNMPRSTVSWHLIFPLKEINFRYWLRVRQKLHDYAKNPIRATEESKELSQFWGAETKTWRF